MCAHVCAFIMYFCKAKDKLIGINWMLNSSWFAAHRNGNIGIMDAVYSMYRSIYTLLPTHTLSPSFVFLMPVYFYVILCFDFPLDGGLYCDASARQWRLLPIVDIEMRLKIKMIVQKPRRNQSPPIRQRNYTMHNNIYWFSCTPAAVAI